MFGVYTGLHISAARFDQNVSTAFGFGIDAKTEFDVCYNISILCVLRGGSAVGRWTCELRLTGRGFNSRPVHFHVT